MIKFLRELIFHDFWLKLFSLGLAVLIWLTVSFAIKKEGLPASGLSLRPEETRTFSELPVFVKFSPRDARKIDVNPKQAEVTVQGDPKILRGLQGKDIQVTVDLTGIEAAHDLKKRIDVSTLAGILIVRVAPQEVQVSFPPSSNE